MASNSPKADISAWLKVRAPSAVQSTAVDKGEMFDLELYHKFDRRGRCVSNDGCWGPFSLK